MEFFHRLTTPGYFTGGTTFPSESGVTYDYINNAGAGTPANADSAKVGGVNAGTYFAAFAEDATSNNLNRSAKALAENCDHLDALFHRDIAVTVRTADTVSAGDSSVVLAAETFLGVPGTPSTAAGLNLLFELTDDNDNEILDNTTGLKCQVTVVALSAPDSIGGGFSQNTVTLTISPAIPAGVTYRLYYGTRANLATLPQDALTNVRIRGAQEVPDDIEKLLRDLHGNSLSWNAAWSSTIYDLAMSGLDGRYRRAAAVSLSPPESYFAQTASTAGAGGWIDRNGPALTVYARALGSYTDPINALFAAKFFDGPTLSGSAGTTGFVAYGARLSGTALPGEQNYVPGTAMFLGLWTHQMKESMHASNPFTRIAAGTSVNLTTPDTNANTGEAVVELTLAADYFFTAGNQCAIAFGYDMLELEYTQGGTVKRQTVVVVTPGASADTTNIRKVRVRNLDGTIPDFTGATSATITKWISTSFLVGDGRPAYHQQVYGYASTNAVLLDGFHYQAPPYLSAGAGDDNIPRTPASFSGYSTGTGVIALRWGGFNNSSLPTGPAWNGKLYANGAIEAGSLTTADGYVAWTTPTNPASTTPYTNKLTAKNVPKCWANIHTVVGGATVDAGFNIASVAIVGNDVEVTMATAMANTNYAVCVTSGSTTSPLVGEYITGKTTTKFYVRAYDTSFSQVNAGLGGVRFSVVVYGAQ